MSTQTQKITWEKRGKVFRIHLNNPRAGNSLTIPQFVYFASLIEKSNNDPDTTITLITSSGRFFSTGANIKTVSKMTGKDSNYYLSEISSKNMFLVNLFLEHKKLLVCALNGPVIGLVASLVCLSDLIYGINEEAVFMSFPFTNIGLINECGVSASLTARLGLSKTLEVVCLSKKLKCKDLLRSGLLNKVYHFHNVDEFNESLVEKMNEELDGLDTETLMQNKQLIKEGFKRSVQSQILNETMLGLEKWTANQPQNAFAEILKGTRKHKL